MTNRKAMLIYSLYRSDILGTPVSRMKYVLKLNQNLSKPVATKTNHCNLYVGKGFIAGLLQ